MASLKVHPRHAVSYAQGRHKGNEVPAIIWLFAAVVLVVVIRDGKLPSQSQAITLALAAGVIVGIGTFVPEIVLLALVAILIAGVLQVPGVGPFLNAAQARVSQLSGRP